MTAFSRAPLLRRTALLASTSLFMMAGASPALAQGRDALIDVMSAEQDAQNASAAANRARAYEALGGNQFGTLDAQATMGLGHIAPLPGQETPSITINNNFNITTDVYDPTNITGVGQMIINNGNGTIGLCTGTLINPRTVIFAAHCVNSRAATAYGANSGGVPIAFGFETNTRANAAGQPDELLNWFNGGSTGPGMNRTNQAQAFYNALQVFYDPRSLAAASCTAPGSCFLEADVALAAFDTPTRNIPTWTMLFSPLATPSTINPASGTGYHVAIGGYGSFGNGTTGSANSGNFRRRLAENILGGLTSINTRNLFLFGTAGTPSRPQLLYWLDFDDPARGTANANPRDFNGFRDNALTREGLTGPGDSGSALIIDQAFGANVRTIIGVLSGGSTFFTGQGGGSYGTQSFYQPLFLYWDWIVANNPYRYATAVAGDRNWEDATAWVTTLDPAYQILSGGQLVNGVPTELGGANVATRPQFGELCFQSPLNSPTPPTNNECENLATGAVRNNVPNTPSGTGDVSTPATAQIVDRTPDGEERIGAGGGQLAIGDAVDSPNAAPGYRDGSLGTPTIANGLPGATNFVPNNSDGNRATGVSARYYDIALRNAGTVTLSSAVTIDNFRIAGAQSQLTVASTGSLTSLIDVNQMTGIMNVNGLVSTPGDYFFMSGLLTGTGRVNANFLTSVIGNFAPGTLGTIGTLTVGGNLVMSSGSTYALDIGPNGTSDRIAVVANGTSAGTANVGGTVIISPVTGSIIRFNDLYTILTAAGGVSGSFTSTNISAILRQTFINNANSVQLRVTAVPFASVVSATSPNQLAFATLLDRNRGTGNLGTLFDVLDLQNQATIQSTLEALAPRTETLRQAMGVSAVDNASREVRERVHGLAPGDLGGRIAFLGRRVETAALALTGLSDGSTTMSDVATQEAASMPSLPETMSAFLSVGYLDGNSAPMASSLPALGRDTYDGFFGTVGVEMEIGERAAVGLSVGYTSLDGNTALRNAFSDVTLFQGSLYGKAELGEVAYIDGQVSVGMLNTDTERQGNLPGQSITLRGEDEALALGGELGIGAMFGERVRVGPRAALRYQKIDFGDITETGGATALVIDRDEYRSIQGRLGVVMDGVGRIRPRVSASYVHDFEDRPTSFGANFVGGGGGNVLFDLAGQDSDWGEISGGVALDLGRVELSVSADTTVGRNDFSNRSYRAGVRISF